jgi:hypothetical protein
MQGRVPPPADCGGELLACVNDRADETPAPVDDHHGSDQECSANTGMS